MTKFELRELLNNCFADKIELEYDVVSLAFPGNKHPRFFGKHLVDFQALAPWINEINWDAECINKQIDPTMEKMPNILFFK